MHFCNRVMIGVVVHLKLCTSALLVRMSPWSEVTFPDYLALEVSGLSAFVEPQGVELFSENVNGYVANR